ncbi:MAG: TonB-dependent receptor [Phenylobacterium sp.]|uniref:TonB-dependent receptor n=1 Tax=Phenylobacterium sp. TaxID=1871053 RepID=UPI00121477BC|nr:TonB-dependent receptor [Phenylobacterium sp.]TAL28451.1 MAG: TonB-dependent receptor [Phenylobacterium sp.]
MLRKTLLGSACVGAMTMGAFMPVSAMAAENETAIEELVVTARMRAESLQETPVAVTAVTENQIAKMFVQDLSDLTRAAPNFTIEGVGAIHRNASVAYSRGIGYQGVDQAIDPSVGIAVDGVFYTRNIGALQSTFDIQQVELLRGPQGTLFGKNTTGGVINITTKKPGSAYSFAGLLRMGNYGRADASMAADLPVSDTLAFRLSATRQHSSGYMHNLYRTPTGLQPVEEWLAGDDVQSIRLAMRWNATEDLEVNASYSYVKDRSDSVSGVNGSFPTDALSRIGRPGFGFPGGPTDPFVAMRNFPSGDFQDTYAGTVNLTYKGQGYRLVSISGIVRSSNFSYSDFDVTDLAFFETTASKRHKTMSQELRFESEFEGPLQFVAGAYAGRTKWDADQIFFLATQTYEASRQKEKTAAGFAQVDFSVTDQLTLTAGGRYSWQEKDFVRRLQRPIATFAATPAVTASEDWSRFTYHLGGNYQINDDAMVYASYSTGFKSGGFNSRAASAATIGPFRPEKARAFEVGLKSDWMENRLRVNVAAFWNKYSDLQVSVFRPATVGTGEEQVVANNANERARGVEFEVTALPVDNLTVTASVGYLDADYTSFVANLSGGAATAANPCGGLRDRSLKGPCLLVPTRVPEITSRIGVSYDFELAGGGTITPDVAWSHEGAHFTDTLNVPQGRQKAYSVWDASLTYVEPKGRWRASLWGKNLNNVAHRLSAVPTAGVLTQLYFAEPRTYGVELRVNLGE